jgi:hypothetical protein
MSQIVLPHTYHAQQRGWSCGASTALVVLSTYGINVTEEQMIAECGTTVDGTPDVANIDAVLTRRTGRQYNGFYMPTDPPSREQMDTFWTHAVETIADSRRGMPVNIWAPANNHPPGYPNYLVMHYISAVGIDTDQRLIYISDSARFQGYEHYWVGADKLCTMITPKGVGYLVAPDLPNPFPALTDQQQGEMLANIGWLRDQLGPNLWGPDSSLGTNAAGQELTFRDSFADLRRQVLR